MVDARRMANDRQPLTAKLVSEHLAFLFLKLCKFLPKRLSVRKRAVAPRKAGLICRIQRVDLPIDYLLRSLVGKRSSVP